MPQDGQVSTDLRSPPSPRGGHKRFCRLTNGTRDAVSGSMWQKLWRKVWPWPFLTALAGYAVTLCALVVHDYMEDLPKWSAAPQRAAVAEALQPRLPQTSFDVYPGTNLQATVRAQLSWKTSMTICPKMSVNSESISAGRIIIRHQ